MFVDDDGPQMIFVDDEQVALWVRVGPVFENGGQRDRPGVWIELQSEYMQTALHGPVLISEEEWHELDRLVRGRFSRA